MKLTGFQYEIYEAVLKGDIRLFIDIGGLEKKFSSRLHEIKVNAKGDTLLHMAVAHGR